MRVCVRVCAWRRGATADASARCASPCIRPHRTAHDRISSSDDDLADDRALAAYREQRLAELKAEAAARRRFGDLRPMSASEWTKEVTEASEECRVVVLMEHAGDAPSDALAECLVAIAKRCPRTKFVRVPATDAVPRYPQRLCPTVIVYHKGDVVQNIAGRELAVFGGAKRLTPESVELVLEHCGALDGEEGRGGAGAREERALQAAARAMADQLAEEERTEAEERARDEEEP